MTGNKTFTIIKPGAVNHEFIGPILNRIHEAKFRIVAMRMVKLRTKQAQAFYKVHKDKPFFNNLIKFMTSGPIVVAILGKPNAVEEYRKLIGHTDPTQAEEGTIRQLFAESMQKNAVHGSDSNENARKEMDFFFSHSERFNEFGEIDFE